MVLFSAAWDGDQSLLASLDMGDRWITVDDICELAAYHCKYIHYSIRCWFEYCIEVCMQKYFTERNFFFDGGGCVFEFPVALVHGIRWRTPQFTGIA